MRLGLLRPLDILDFGCSVCLIFMDLTGCFNPRQAKLRDGTQKHHQSISLAGSWG